MPLRPDSPTVTDGKVTNVQLNRQVTYGNLIQFLVLDTRQFRTEQPCGDQGSLIETSCKDRLQDPISRLNRRHTILGGPTLGTTPGQDAQEIWLKEQGKLTSPPYKWNVLAQQVPMFQYNHYDWTGNWYSESWDSYTAVRGRILNHIAQNNVPNAVVITGDMHSCWAANLEKNFNDKTSLDVVATEFCSTSISSKLSTGSGSWDETYKNAFNRTGNKHVKFYNGQNSGYGLCTIDNNKWTTEYYLAGSSKPIKTYWVYAKGSGPSGGIIDPKTNRPAVPTLSTDL
jgi:alkaline phosphatase D